jgi:trigger factor
LTSFWRRAVASIDELKAKIKEDADSICNTSRPKLLGDVTEFLIESTKFDLQNFLKMVTNCRRKTIS